MWSPSPLFLLKRMQVIVYSIYGKEKVAPPRRKSDTVRYGVSDSIPTPYSHVVQVFLDHRYYDLRANPPCNRS